jgi:peptidoglycan hydrolase CwlO-like protein
LGRYPAGPTGLSSQRRSVRRRVLARLIAVAGIAAVLGPSVGVAGAAGPVTSSASVRAAQTVDLSVAQAQDELSAARARRADAEARLGELQAAADATQAQLAQLGEQRKDVLNRLAQTQQEAQKLAVDAYVRGAGTDELAAVLDTKEATDAAWRRHLTVGRVDQASEAAFKLRDLREQVDGQLAQLADQATNAQQAVADAQEDVRQSTAGEAQAESALAEARLAEQRAAEARAAEAARQRDAERIAQQQAADARVTASRSVVSSSDTPSPDSPVATSPPTPVARVSLGDPWAYLRDCESGGNYRAVSADGHYRGAYQFDVGTWESMGGRGDPAAASPAEQDARAYALYQQRGRSPWPLCGRYLP